MHNTKCISYLHMGGRNSTVLQTSKNTLIIRKAIQSFLFQKSFLAYICTCYQQTGKNVFPLGGGRPQSTLPFLYSLLLWCYSIWDHESFSRKNSVKNVRKTTNWLAGLPTKSPASVFELVHRSACLACYQSRQLYSAWESQKSMAY